MKTGRNLMELAAELSRQAETKKDYLADPRALRLEPTADGTVLLQGINGGLPLRPIAHAQLASTLGIPKAYYDRLLADAPDLLAVNVNRWLHAQRGTRLIRTLDDTVRAFLTDCYLPLDNIDLAEAVLPELAQVRVVSCEVTEGHFYLKAVSDRLQGEVKVGDVIQGGLGISNSEVGLGSLRLDVLDLRLVCTNGMMVVQRAKTALRQPHLGRLADQETIEDARELVPSQNRIAKNRTFFRKVREAARAMFDSNFFEARLTRYRNAAARPLGTDPAKLVDKLAKRFDLNEAEKSSVLRHLIAANDLSAWGLANAITRAAEDQPDYDRATELETLGGRVVELEPGEWAAMAA